jgi:hypothetical protein
VASNRGLRRSYSLAGKFGYPHLVSTAKACSQTAWLEGSPPEELQFQEPAAAPKRVTDPMTKRAIFKCHLPPGGQ